WATPGAAVERTRAKTRLGDVVWVRSAVGLDRHRSPSTATTLWARRPLNHARQIEDGLYVYKPGSMTNGAPRLYSVIEPPSACPWNRGAGPNRSERNVSSR